jgi:hypothetical protein
MLDHQAAMFCPGGRTLARGNRISTYSPEIRNGLVRIDGRITCCCPAGVQKCEHGASDYYDGKGLEIVFDDMGFRFVTILVLIAGSALLCAAAEDSPPLVTDRPDQTESSETVPLGAVQLEVGWTHSEDRDNPHAVSDSFPETLVRLGLWESCELRVGFDGYLWQDSDEKGAKGVTHDGNGDMEVGFKYKISEESGMRPQAAVMCGLTLPTGDRAFSSERFDPSVRFAFSHTLSETLSFGYNVATIWGTEEDAAGDRDTRASWACSVVLGIAVTERLGTFVEYFSEIPTGSGSGPSNSFDTGFTYLVRDNLQFDVLGGVGLSDQADDWFIGAGFVYRTP